MIIEFFGISGVGKTTVAKEYLKNSKDIEWPRYELYEKNNWLLRNLKKALYIVYFCIFNFKWVIKLNNLVKLLEINGFKDKFSVLFNGCFLKFQLLNCKKEKKYIFDEGVFQYVWALYLRTLKEPSEKIIVGILDLYGIPDEVNIVVADTEIIKERLIKRGRKTKILEKKDLINEIEKMKNIQNEILKFSNNLIQEKSVVIKNIDTNEEIKR